MEIEVETEAGIIGVATASAILDNVFVKRSRKEVFDILQIELRKELRERIGTLDRLKMDPTIRALRSFYWKIGIDPTKTRPSSEALVRRVLHKGLPMINNLVDAGNLASARDFVPIGLYDLSKIKGSAVIMITRGGETFHGIGGKEEALEPGIPVMADDLGVIHLYPHRDCIRTRITETSSDVLMVACGVKEMKDRILNEALLDVEEYFSDLEV